MNDMLYSGQTETQKWTEENPRCPIPDTKMDQDSFITSVSELIFGFLFLNFAFVGILCTAFISYINKLTRTHLPEENAALNGLEEELRRESNIRQQSTTYLILGMTLIFSAIAIMITCFTIY